GGYGDPLERDVDAVVRDVRDELVSAQAARDDYGVVLTTDGQAADLHATLQLRAMRRATRNTRTLSNPLEAGCRPPEKGRTT
ncbi:MAG TPA: hypothetical protein VMV45_21650, partial [Casimicrobiaceae bacterium]|nr:hypothetical protein [Casimicrobiaceae bacterium]